jgi:CubicO group peptidase (beta-lactamase class C family)
MGNSAAEILEAVPSRFRGPGGAVAVLKDGQVAGTKVWGFADLDRRIAMAEDTVIPICSITKQMLCGLLTDLQRNPSPAMVVRGGDPAEQLYEYVGKVVDSKLLENTGLTLSHLCNNQSGIRDYWALTVLWGARPDDRFGVAEHGPLMLERMKSFHFEPGTEYAYSNTNFFILARAIEKATEQSLEQLLRERIFDPAGMKTAALCANTADHPSPCVGYEGDENFGFYQAINRIEWAGDAGIVASLQDMISYEKFVDDTRDQSAWYQMNAKEQLFKDGAAADYGYGLARTKVGDVTVLGHGGALRGYRLNRLYAPELRISVVALLNQEHGNAGLVCEYILKQLCSIPESNHETVEAEAQWVGTYLDSETQLAITVELGVSGQLLLKYHRKPEKLRVVGPFRAESADLVATLDGDTLHLQVPKDNRKITATRAASSNPASSHSDLNGKYYCSEIDSTLHCDGSGGMFYGSFDGFLGKGPVHLMRPLASDVWALACPRAMDSTPPGDWTVVIHRDESGNIANLTVGCWLARKLQYSRLQ